MEEKAALDACRGGTAKCLEMQLQTALWGENHGQPRTETPSSAEREIGNEKHAQCKKTQKPDAYLRLPVQAACVLACASSVCPPSSLFSLPLEARAVCTGISLCIRHGRTRYSPPRSPQSWAAYRVREHFG